MTGRIAIVCHAHPSISKGGGEIAAYTLFEGLTALGHKPIFIAACAEPDRAKLALGSDNERAVFHDPMLYDWFYNLGSPSILGELQRIIADENIKIVNFQHFINFGIGAIRAISAQPEITTFVTLHEYLAICFHHGQMITHPKKVLCERSSPQSCWACYPDRTRQQFALRKNLFLESFKGVKGFVSPSRFLKQRFVDWGLAADSMAVIENGLSRLLPKAPPRARNENTQWVFGFFGQINPFKGVDMILRAVELIGGSKSLANRISIRIHGNIVGQTEEFEARFTKMVRKYDFLSYAGPYENSSVGRLMADCDYVLIPSTWWENSPVVIQEAFAAGRPVICTGIGGMAEKVQNGVSGLHFRFGDPADLVSTLDKAADPDSFAQLSAGIPGVYDAAGMAREYLKVFDQFVRTEDQGRAAQPAAPGPRPAPPRVPPPPNGQRPQPPSTPPRPQPAPAGAAPSGAALNAQRPQPPSVASRPQPMPAAPAATPPRAQPAPAASPPATTPRPPAEVSQRRPG